jgi:predicted NAD/FAD-dependent oxidoreductase
MIFNFNSLLLALLISEASTISTSYREPICIVGAGISGLSAAHKLKEKGYSVKLFEKDSIVGGKMHVYRKDGAVWNMGPVALTDYYNRTLDIVKKHNIKITTQHVLSLAGYQPETNIHALLPQIANDPSVKEAFARYYEIRKSYNIETGLINANPELFVSTSEWLKANKLEALQSYAIIFLTSEGYGHVDDTPALYFIHILDLSKNVAEDIHTILDGMDQIPNALAKGLDITLNAKVSKISRNDRGTMITYSTRSGTKTQSCSSAIIAFPPLLNQVNGIIPDLSDREKNILKQVKIHKYATVANYATGMKYFGYAPLLPPNLPPKLDGGRVALIANHSRGAAVTYHWTRGQFDAGPTDEELSQYQSEVNKVFPKLFPSKDTKTNLYVKGWDYFPHVTTKSLQDGFYKKFNSIQGKKNIYYATPLLGFEVIEHSIRAAEYVVGSFY